MRCLKVSEDISATTEWLKGKGPALRQTLLGIAQRAAYVQIAEIVKMDMGWETWEALNRLAGEVLFRRHRPRKVSVKESGHRRG